MDRMSGDRDVMITFRASESLRAAARVSAAQRGITLRELIVEAMTEAVRPSADSTKNQGGANA